MLMWRILVQGSELDDQPLAFLAYDGFFPWQLELPRDAERLVSAVAKNPDVAFGRGRLQLINIQYTSWQNHVSISQWRPAPTTV
jgi:hypothetical protein